ncbi:hypothetical protein HMN09_01188800 [Mycena chlorophos]|uniref:Uncharacterized protein n=1 Tax=Mycena chlorophos TaxID=658473 RepID=A0A8H6S8V0_MYCCL|nr:hypothetical protein HMN09_01188800 [Mycena chlorophos]
MFNNNNNANAGPFTAQDELACRAYAEKLVAFGASRGTWPGGAAPRFYRDHYAKLHPTVPMPELYTERRVQMGVAEGLRSVEQQMQAERIPSAPGGFGAQLTTEALATVLRSIRQPAPIPAPVGPFAGCPTWAQLYPPRGFRRPRFPPTYVPRVIRRKFKNGRPGRLSDRIGGRPVQAETARGNGGQRNARRRARREAQRAERARAEAEAGAGNVDALADLAGGMTIGDDGDRAPSPPPYEPMAVGEPGGEEPEIIGDWRDGQSDLEDEATDLSHM